jgi:hypothetical protein
MKVLWKKYNFKKCFSIVKTFVPCQNAYHHKDERHQTGIDEIQILQTVGVNVCNCSHFFQLRSTHITSRTAEHEQEDRDNADDEHGEENDEHDAHARGEIVLKPQQMFEKM